MNEKDLKIGYVYDVKFLLKDLPSSIMNNIEDRHIIDSSYIIQKAYLIKNKTNILSKLYLSEDYYILDSFKYNEKSDYNKLPESDYLVEFYDTVLSVSNEQIINISKCEKDGLIYLQNAIEGKEYYIIGSLLNDNVKLKFNTLKKVYKKNKFEYNNKTYRHLYYRGEFTFNDSETQLFGNMLTKLKDVVE